MPMCEEYSEYKLQMKLFDSIGWVDDPFLTQYQDVIKQYQEKYKEEYPQYQTRILKRIVTKWEVLDG